MTFDDNLDQVIAFLKRQGRVSYGALKRRFDLDDAYLEDLKGEILFAYPVVDEDGRGLVWTGDTASAQAVVSPLLRPHNSRRPRSNPPCRVHLPCLHLLRLRYAGSAESEGLVGRIMML